MIIREKGVRRSVKKKSRSFSRLKKMSSKKNNTNELLQTISVLKEGFFDKVL
jgi:hypothetical protein